MCDRCSVGFSNRGDNGTCYSGSCIVSDGEVGILAIVVSITAVSSSICGDHGRCDGLCIIKQ